jgi:lysophospholipase L1-like esterase
MRMFFRAFAAAVVALACVSVGAQPPAAPSQPGSKSQPAKSKAADESRWEADIRRFEERDKKSPPPADAVLFLGSSSIVRWNVKKWFPDLATINRGFGGSQIADSVRYAERIVVPYKPRTIVFYAGDNDLASGKTPERVAADFQALAAKVHAALPKTRIVCIALKPSVARLKLVDRVHETNRLIRKAIEKDERAVFVDVETPMLGPDGKPRADLLDKDGLHLNDDGYKLWTALVRKHL